MGAAIDRCNGCSTGMFAARCLLHCCRPFCGLVAHSPPEAKHRCGRLFCKCSTERQGGLSGIRHQGLGGSWRATFINEFKVVCPNQPSGGELFFKWPFHGRFALRGVVLKWAPQPTGTMAARQVCLPPVVFFIVAVRSVDWWRAR